MLRYLSRCELPVRGPVLGPQWQSAGPCVSTEIQDAVQSRAFTVASLRAKGNQGRCLSPPAAPRPTGRSTIASPRRTPLRPARREARVGPAAGPIHGRSDPSTGSFCPRVSSGYAACLQGGPINFDGTGLWVTRPCERGGHQGRIAAKRATMSCRAMHDEVEACTVLWLYTGGSRVGLPAPRLPSPVVPKHALPPWRVWPASLFLGMQGRGRRRLPLCRRNLGWGRSCWGKEAGPVEGVVTCMACGGKVVAASAGMAVSQVPACGPACKRSSAWACFGKAAGKQCCAKSNGLSGTIARHKKMPARVTCMEKIIVHRGWASALHWFPAMPALPKLSPKRRPAADSWHQRICLHILRFLCRRRACTDKKPYLHEPCRSCGCVRLKNCKPFLHA